MKFWIFILAISRAIFAYFERFLNMKSSYHPINRYLIDLDETGKSPKKSPKLALLDPYLGSELEAKYPSKICKKIENFKSPNSLPKLTLTHFWMF